MARPQSYQATLACPITLPEQAHLRNRAIVSEQNYWIGLSDTLHEGQWAMPAVTSVAGNGSWPWCPGEPNNGGGGSVSGGTHGGGDCVYIRGKASARCEAGRWSDYRCDASHGEQHGDALNEFGFVCEFSPERRRAFERAFVGDDAEGRGSGGSVAIGWIAALSICLAASCTANMLLSRDGGRVSRLKAMLARRNRTATTPVFMGSAPLDTTYSAPLRPPDVADSTATNPL